jgi:hypothetical protein
MENLEKSHTAHIGMCTSNTQYISSKKNMLAQVADVKFYTLCEIPTSFLWIGEIGKVEIFEKSHATHTNTHVNDFQHISLTENTQAQVAYEKFHTPHKISMSFLQIGENLVLRNFFNMESCSTTPTNVHVNHSNFRHSKENDT